MNRIWIGCFLFLLLSLPSHGQVKKITLQPYLAYQGYFDNREFFQTGIQPNTFFGQRVSPGFTTRLDSSMQLVVAVNAWHEFGNPRWITSVVPEVFFWKETEQFRLIFGAFPREKGADTLALALFADSLRYTRPNATGFSLRHQRKQGYSTVWIDWSGQKTEKVREQFFIGTTHEGTWQHWHWRLEAGLTHLAKSAQPTPEQFIEEQAVLLLQAGPNIPFGPGGLKMRVGWLQSFERVRNGSQSQSPTSLWLQGHYQIRRWQLRHTRKHGEAHQLLLGDPFYRFENYHRTDLEYTWGWGEHWQIEAHYSLHRANQVFSHQQRLLVRFQW